MVGPFLVPHQPILLASKVVGEGASGNTARRGCKGVGPGQTCPPLSSPGGGKGMLGAGEVRGGGLVQKGARVQTPPDSQAPPPRTQRGWGRRRGESLSGLEGQDRLSRGGAGCTAAQGEWGRGVRGPTWSGCDWQGATGFPGEPGKPSRLDSGFPPASGLGLLQEAGLPLGPKTHFPALALSPSCPLPAPRLGQHPRRPPASQG